MSRLAGVGVAEINTPGNVCCGSCAAREALMRHIERCTVCRPGEGVECSTGRELSSWMWAARGDLS